MLRNLILLLALAALPFVTLGCDKDPETACKDSGGTVITQQCCLSADEFPDTCSIGACGCSVENSHGIKSCTCPAGKCFDGTECVDQ